MRKNNGIQLTWYGRAPLCTANKIYRHFFSEELLQQFCTFTLNSFTPH